jgi:hypothetical protein
MPADDIAAATAAETPQPTAKRRPGPVQTVSNNTSAAHLGCPSAGVCGEGIGVVSLCRIRA